MTEGLFLKPVFSRKLKSGKWIVLAEEAVPLVVDEELAKCLAQSRDELECYSEDVLNILKENGFYADSSTEMKKLPKESTSLQWKLARGILFIIGALSSITVLVLTLFYGVPSGSKIINDSVPLLINILYIVIFSLSTTLVHELMHVIFARTFGYKAGGLRLQFSKAKATVSMTHIWLWSFLSRFAALSAGVIFDFFLLACLSLVNLVITNWMLTAAISILWLRIIWQFRFHKNCDGQLIALSVLDNPMLALEQTDEADKDVQTWRKLKIIGYLVDAIIVVYWLIPLFWSLILAVFSKFFS
ncbi:hypothetical protein [Bacillus xiapuensis]|uniref:hypothetical protein n=1 Tax=Bacillus xiapuensis TaxID=2014075 RepID=UPI000C240AEB|nr:hypothetical protein [Bacillus xiapuensis]